MNKFRAVQGTASVIGSTPVGKSGLQFKSWAVPIMYGHYHNMKAIKEKYKETQKEEIRNGASPLASYGRSTMSAMSTEEAMQVYRAAAMTAVAAYALTQWNDDDDEDMVKFKEKHPKFSRLVDKIGRESMSTVGALDPRLLIGEPPSVSFAGDIAGALVAMMSLLRFHTLEVADLGDESSIRNKEGDLKAWEDMKTIFRPAFIKQYIYDERDEPNKTERVWVDKKYRDLLNDNEIDIAPVQKTFTHNEKEYELSGADLQVYTENFERFMNAELDGLLQNAAFNRLTPENKKKEVQSVRRDALLNSKMAYLSQRGGVTLKTSEKITPFFNQSLRELRNGDIDGVKDSYESLDANSQSAYRTKMKRWKSSNTSAVKKLAERNEVDSLILYLSNLHTSEIDRLLEGIRKTTPTVYDAIIKKL